MGVLERARAHLRRRRALSKRAALEVGRLFARVDHKDIARSWAASIPAVLTVVESAQAIAAASAGVYLDDLLEGYGLPDGSAGRVRVDGFAGVASDGRDLATLMYQPAITALQTIQKGGSERAAMASGRFVSELITRTQVSDAGRTADGVALTARPQLAGWVRMLSLPSCSRCIILAGRFYRWNADFPRHPACDCTQVPAPEDAAGDLRTDPKLAFESMEPAEQDRVFTKAGAQAIRDGADIYQVVNARRGIAPASQVKVLRGGRSQTTSTGTTRRGLAGRRLRGAPRLMPGAIYKQAAGDRDEALRLLRLHGFIL